MSKAVRKASFGTEGNTGQKYGGRISDSLLGEKNGLARAEEPQEKPQKPRKTQDPADKPQMPGKLA